MERGRIQGVPTFFAYPLLSQERIKLPTSNLAGIFGRSIRTKALKILGGNGAWAYPGTAQIFGVPPIISGTGKATNFKFCTHIVTIDRNKSPSQICGKVARCVVRTLKTFQGTSRGLLCDSSAVLYTVKLASCVFVLVVVVAVTCYKFHGHECGLNPVIVLSIFSA